VLRILYVEDNDDNVFMLKMRLELCWRRRMARCNHFHGRPSVTPRNPRPTNKWRSQGVPWSCWPSALDTVSDIVDMLETWESRPWGGFRSMNGDVDPFAVTAGAFVRARFPPMLGWCGHHDSHFLRTFRTK